MISIIIPCLGHAAELTACLNALQVQEGNSEFEVIVVDSASDPRVEAAVKPFAQVRLVRSAGRLFPGGARNLGVRHAAGNGLAFLDADCIPSGDWVSQAGLSLRAGRKIVVGPILDVKPFHPIGWADNRLQFSDFQVDRPDGPIDYLPACNLAMSRTVFAVLRGFREDVLTGEDGLLSEQARTLFPREIFFNQHLVVRHYGRTALRGMLEHQRSLGYHRGRLRLAMTPFWLQLARSPWLGWMSVMRRLSYIFLRTWQYDKKGLAPLALFSPFLVLGLIAWTRGFYQGVKANR